MKFWSEGKFFYTLVYKRVGVVSNAIQVPGLVIFGQFKPPFRDSRPPKKEYRIKNHNFLKSVFEYH